jgi:hypothetical protein
VWGSSRVGAIGFSARYVQTASGSHPAYSSTCSDVLPSLPGVIRSECKFNNIFPSTAKFKNYGGHTSTPPIRLHAADGENFFVWSFKEGLDLLLQWDSW